MEKSFAVMSISDEAVRHNDARHSGRLEQETGDACDSVSKSHKGNEKTSATKAGRRFAAALIAAASLAGTSAAVADPADPYPRMAPSKPISWTAPRKSR